MIKKYSFKTILLLSTILLLASCKKEYTCTCTDPSGGKTIAFTEKTTKGKASDKCNDYYNAHYGNIPWNETGCSIK